MTHFIRPLLFDGAGGEGLPDWVAALPARPTVYATLGTIMNHRQAILEAILRALGGMPVNLILTVGRDGDPARLGPAPPNARVERYLPQSLILPHCDLVIAHGGWNTVMAALAHALPLVLIPLGADQPENARRCVAAGVGRCLDPVTVTPAAIRDAVDDILRGPSYRWATSRLRAEMAGLPGLERAVGLLDHLITPRAASSTPRPVGLDWIARKTDRATVRIQATDEEMTKMGCAICGNEHGNRRVRAREMMFGTREQFDYLQCAACQCLQLARPPTDMAGYYPDGYYALARSDAERGAEDSPSWFATMLDGPVVIPPHFYRAGWQSDRDRVLAEAVVRWYFPAWITRESLILDVGCGTGGLISALGTLGFRHLLGVDPYVAGESGSDSRVPVVRGTIDELPRAGVGWDLIMFHHSFEHVADPLATLRATARLLAPSGICLLRIPTVASHAWEHYGADWVQLDAPRHTFLHTHGSIRLLAKRSGLRIVGSFCDSTAFQFWGSELYRRDIPLVGSVASADPVRHSLLSRGLRRWFAEQARHLNTQGRGDQVACYLAPE